MPEPQRISYLTDDPTPDYVRGLTGAGTLAELRTFINGWRSLAPDARKVVMKMTEAEFAVWRAGMMKERRRRFAGEEWASQYAVVLMPGRLFRATDIAQRYMVPWGTAWLRLKQVGLLDG